jgi:hypothetical protein
MAPRWFDIPLGDWVSLNKNLRRLVAELAAGGGGGGSGANLGYVAATRTVTSDTGTDAVLPVVTTSAAGLAPASGGGTDNFLRADGTWAAPPGGGGGGSSYFPSGW